MNEKQKVLVERASKLAIASQLRDYSGVVLSGTQDNKSFFNVRKHLRKNGFVAAITSEDICYENGYSFATDGQLLFINREDYSPIYEGAAINNKGGEIRSYVRFPNVKSVVAWGTYSLYNDESEKLLAAIDKQKQMYKESDTETRQKIREARWGCGSIILKTKNGDGKDVEFIIGYKKAQAIKHFAKSFGEFIVVIEDEQEPSKLKILADGAMLVLMADVVSPSEYDETKLDLALEFKTTVTIKNQY